MKKLRLAIVFGFIMMLVSCEDPWEKHLDEFSTSRATQDLLEIVQETSELSQFYQLITDAGVEGLLTEDRISTLWAPNNDVIASLPSDITGDEEKLVQFLENHLTYGMYPQAASQVEFRCKMRNGKRVLMNMAVPTIYGETITGDFNKIATNGILHIIDQSIELRSSIWEYVEAYGEGNDQLDFLNSLTGDLFVDSLADIIDYDPVTSDPIYDTLSGTIWYNQYLFENADLRNEDSLFTFVILDNSVFQDHYDRFTPYYRLKDTDPRDTLEFRKYMVSLDLVAENLWRIEDIPGDLPTIHGVQLPLNAGTVTETIEASNGIIYHLSSCDLSLENKFPPIIVEAETENKVLLTGNNNDGFTRVKPLASGGFDYVLDDHDGSPGRIVYNAGMVAATTYEFYWLAVDDFGGSYYGAAPDSLIRQKLEKITYLPDQPFEYRYPVHRSISDSMLYVSDLSYDTAQLRYAGKFHFDYYQDLWFDVVGSGSNTTITLDYVKIVPVFE